MFPGDACALLLLHVALRNSNYLKIPVIVLLPASCLVLLSSDVRLRLFDMQSLVAKIAYYNHGRHDHYLNPLFFTLKLAGALGAFALCINYGILLCQSLVMLFVFLISSPCKSHQMHLRAISDAQGALFNCVFSLPLRVCILLILSFFSIAARNRGPKDAYATGIDAIADHIGSARFTLRFLSAFSCLDALLKNDDMGDKSQGEIIKKVNRLKLYFGLLASVMEYPAYLNMIAPQLVKGTALETSAFSRVGCICWLACTLIDQYLIHQSKCPDYVGSVAAACDSVLAYNWFLKAEDQILSNMSLGLVGCVSSYIGFTRSFPVSIKDE